MAKAIADVNRHMIFDLSSWMDGKTFTYVGAEVWRDRDTKEPCGVRHHIMVTRDETEYPREDMTNLGAQLTVKERGTTPDQVKFVPFETVVEVADVEKATPWHPGDNQYMWDISIIAKLRAARAATGKGGE